MSSIYVDSGYYGTGYTTDNIYIFWDTFEIFVPKSAMTLLQMFPVEIYQLNINDFHLKLRAIEDDVIGISYPTTHRYIAPIEIGGVTLSRVMEVLSPYTITFEDGKYAVNIEGGNSNLADVNNINNVGVRTANSAGLQDLETLTAAAYQNAVHVHTVKGQSGTSVPIGTRENPVSNYDDALIIAESLGIRTIVVMDSVTLNTGSFIDGYTFLGDNPVTTILTLEDESTNVTSCEFKNLTIQGILDGSNILKECTVLDLSYVNGFIHNCALGGKIDVSGGQLTLLDCYSNIAGGEPGQYVSFDMGGANNSLAVRNYSGGFHLSNYSGGTGAISIDMSSGRVIVDEDVTGGNVYIRGVAEVIDNSTGTATTFDQTVNKAISSISTPVATISYKDMILIGELSK